MRKIVLAAAFALAACQPAAKPATTPAAREAGANEVAVTGAVSRIEDGGYPMATVTVERDGQAPLSLTINQEDVDLGGKAASDFQGKVTAVIYSTAPQNDLKSIAAARPNAPAAAGAVTGVLSGAEAVSAGDLPDTLVVTDAAGKAVEFPYFITPEIVALNGKQVTAVYETSPQNRIVYMRAN